MSSGKKPTNTEFEFEIDINQLEDETAASEPVGRGAYYDDMPKRAVGRLFDEPKRRPSDSKAVVISNYDDGGDSGEGGFSEPAPHKDEERSEAPVRKRLHADEIKHIDRDEPPKPREAKHVPAIGSERARLDKNRGANQGSVRRRGGQDDERDYQEYIAKYRERSAKHKAPSLERPHAAVKTDAERSKRHAYTESFGHVVDDSPWIDHVIRLKYLFIVILVSIVLIVFAFALKVNSLGGKLKEANKEITQLKSDAGDYNKLLLSNEQLEKKVRDLTVELEEAKKPAVSENPQVEPTPGPGTAVTPPQGGGASTGPQVHTVVSGDNLWKISQKYGVTEKAIKDANNLTSDTIQPGQKLTIPKP